MTTTTHEMSQVERDYAVRFDAHVNAVNAEVAYHCAHDGGRHSIRITNGPNTVYVIGTTRELSAFMSAFSSAIVDGFADDHHDTDEVE